MPSSRQFVNDRNIFIFIATVVGRKHIYFYSYSGWEVQEKAPVYLVAAVGLILDSWVASSLPGDLI